MPVAAHLVAPVFDQEIINILDRHGVDEQARTSLRLLAGRWREAAVDILWRLNRREAFAFGLVGVSERAVFVIDAEGTITYAWVGEHPGIFPDLDAVKAALAK